MSDITILLVDDQALMRMGMSMVLGQADGMRVVGEAASGESAIERVRALKPDVVLMDVRMPGMDGIEATRVIARDHPASSVIILTTFDLDEYALGGLNAGASGFLIKDTPAAELVQAVRTVADGDAIVSPRITRRLLEIHRSAMAPTDADSNAHASLTDRERDVLLGIARGLSNTEIAAELFLSESTVKTYVGRVLAKLGVRDRVHAVIHAYQSGLV
ncbi:DNA-binding NarL/FixJ family response regulator [Conyzicola nivalis]|uniref:DNA-binding NarL/FixJ family response regulator n=1 Tax=Conyzicola nivalis TaxID=1477021 RepID=A0ABV2QQN9_9MICO